MKEEQMKQDIKIRFGLAFDLIIETERKIDDFDLLKHIKANPKKENEYRAPPHKYDLIFNMFEHKGYEVKSLVLEDSSLSEDYKIRFKAKLNLRDYQNEAINQFISNKGRGVVILPTAAGKTLIGLKAIEELGEKTVIVVPTKNLLYQWIDHISKYTSLTRDMIGQLGDQVKEIKEITVTTYDSARLNINLLRKTFNLLIFDEAHHGAAKETLKVLEGLPARFRLGLTATPDRSDKGEELLFKLIGKPIIVAKVSDLARDGYVANYKLKSVKVPLDEEERILYDEYMEIYRGYLRRRKIQIKTPQDYERYLIFRVNQDSEAKAALDAHRKARTLVFSSKSKLRKIESILKEHQNDKIIIFSEFNDMVYQISRNHLIPAITHETKSLEREDILGKFGKGEYSKIVTGKVLDEGWDCGSVNVGVIVSGTGQARQFIQRLGRILRPKEGEAILYELVSPETLEAGTVKRRRKSEVL
ncbi:MAG: DEAD/DEAH box helicase [Candidatus Heimdallarchaeota archaeon]|nr:DEAD/DEAH box helicase [Candidatus Heimdallarchaeota archaeon]MCK4769904.1 DEAD/DEAH box helicase [Candidatus Heimdallarchaeota archaeon]